MNVVWHSLITTVVAVMMGFDKTQVLVITTGGVLIDLDHLPYYIEKYRQYGSWTQTWADFKADFNTHTPHKYYLHTVEAVTASLLLFPFLGIGAFIHLVTDAVVYRIHHKTFFPWILNFSLFTLLRKDEKQAEGIT